MTVSNPMPLKEFFPQCPDPREMADVPTIVDVLAREDQLLAEEARPKQLHPASLRFLEAVEEVRAIHLSKSEDYGSMTDPLANIRNGARFVGIEPWRGCMVRLSDKVTRLETFNRTGKLRHETVEDTLIDLAAYALLALTLYREENDRPAAADRR
jgi:hypothetical protein